MFRLEHSVSLDSRAWQDSFRAKSEPIWIDFEVAKTGPRRGYGKEVKLLKNDFGGSVRTIEPWTEV